MVYLDNNATTRPCAEAARAVAQATTELWANPSSAHRAGQEVRRAVELARRDLATLIGVKAREIVFTSGGTESVDLAIRGALAARGNRAEPPVVLTTTVEHAAVRDLCDALAKRGDIEVRHIPLRTGGTVDVDRLGDVLADGRVTLASVQWANNETGAVQPIHQIHHACRDAGVALHCDATQWIGKMPVDGEAGPPCDLLTCSPHKFHGPKGVGVLWTRRGLRLRSTIHGAQELGLRGGTEPVPAILGAGAAARAAAEFLRDPAPRAAIESLRDRFERRVLERVPDAVVNRPVGDRLWNTSNIGFPRLEAEALLLWLSERGLCCSAGAACSSGSLEPSPVLLAMGVPPEVAHGSLRFSLSRDTAEDEIERGIGLVADAVAALRGVTGP